MKTLLIFLALCPVAMALPRGDGSSGDHWRNQQRPAATQRSSGDGRRASYQYSYPGLYYQPVYAVPIYADPYYRGPVRGRSRPFYGPVTGLRWYAL